MFQIGLGIQLTKRERGNFEGDKCPAQDVPGHVRESDGQYTQFSSKRLMQQGPVPIRCVWGVLDGGAHWRHLANTIELSMCGAMRPRVKLLIIVMS